jgi:hypothetical protein
MSRSTVPTPLAARRPEPVEPVEPVEPDAAVLPLDDAARARLSARRRRSR